MLFDDVLKTLNSVINYFKIELFITKDSTIIHELLDPFHILRIKLVRKKIETQECIRKIIKLLELS